MADTAGLDLTPRRVGTARRTPRWVLVAVLVAVAVAIVTMIWFLVRNTSSFYEADEAVARRDDLGDRRIQLLGAPITTGEDLTVGAETGQAFSVVFDGVTADVVFLGTTADLFQPNVPVVLEGSWVRVTDEAPPVGAFACGANDGWWFRADHMLVKHDDEYREDRIDIADGRGGADCVTP